MTTALLTVKGLRKGYGARSVVDIDHLELCAGAGYLLTGDNGAGKTTLLRLLAGLEGPDAGECEYHGRPVELDPYPMWLRREIVYVHQQPYLFNTSIAHNIAYGLRVRGVDKDRCDAMAIQAIEWAGLARLNGVPPHRLSGGETQRVALARAKVLEPRILLLDEPTASLDADARHQVGLLIERLLSADHCIVLACHDHEIQRLPRLRRLHLSNGKFNGAE